jgi:hypothetical protein
MGDTAEQITGLLPTVVAGGVAIKFTQSLFGKPSSSKKSKARKGYPSTKYRPW